MVEFETKNGKRILINPEKVCAVMEEVINGTSCLIYMPDADPWYVRGSFQAVKQKLSANQDWLE